MPKEQENNTPADGFTPINGEQTVLMLMGERCAFCGPMMQALTELMKLGHIAELKIVNIEKNIQLAQQLGVRSVPWVKIGPFELQGSRSKSELLDWLKRAKSSEGMTDYLEEILTEGNIELATKLLQRYPPAIKSIVDLMADPEAKINVRLGVGAIIEDIAESAEFKEAIPRLIDFLKHKDARVRGDACHYLSLTNDKGVIPLIETLLKDENEEVKEIAQESLEALNES